MIETLFALVRKLGCLLFLGMARTAHNTPRRFAGGECWFAPIRICGWSICLLRVLQCSREKGRPYGLLSLLGEWAVTGDDEFPQPQAVPSEFLTPELRAKFDRKGEALVLQEIHRYSTFEKRQAAVDWCQERREERERRETRRYHVMVVLTAAAAVSAFFSAAVAKNWL